VEKEVSGLVGGRVVGRLEGVGRRFQKKLGSEVGPKKTVARRKKCKGAKKAEEKKTYKMRKKNKKKIKVQKEKNDADQVGDSFIPSMKIPERDFLDGALVGAGSLRPLKRENVGRQF
jgi:hypothetical protein